MKKYALVDIDDTISQSWRREHMIPNWDDYHQDLINDDPIDEMVTFVNSLRHGGMFVHGFTSRPEKWRAHTNAWLVKHRVRLDDLHMRPDGDFRASPLCKLDMAIRAFGTEDDVRKHVAFIVDDREDIIKAFAGIGVTALHIYARRP